MNRARDPRIVGAWLVGLASLVIYTLTIAPTVAFWDVGEFIATSLVLGVPHPPGSPTFVLLGHLFTMVPTPFHPAAEVNFVSVLFSAGAALLLYGVIIEVLALWKEGDEKWGGFSHTVQAIAAGTGALAYAFSSSAWFNAVEAEVYGLSMFVTALCLWLALRHVRRGGDAKPASLLLLIGYVLGIGAGNHLLALLTIPSIIILLWYLDRPSLKSVPVWLGAVVLFGVGYSIYMMLYIRSGLNPPIDMNNPENLYNFMQFIQRKQYGDVGLLSTMAQRRAGWDYQVNFQFLRYFRAQFLLPFYLLAMAGALFNLYRDKRTFFAIGALWVIMGFGLVVYLNMPDPQPRDRDYIFVGCYFATAIWIGTGVAGLAGYLRKWVLDALVPPAEGEKEKKKGTGEAPPPVVVGGRGIGPAGWVTAIVGLVAAGLVVAQIVTFYHSHDRTGDHLAWDYGWNILQSVPPGAILFTNGDNDTYPLWYLQVVEGVRRDVRVVNLSLLNTDWYIKELRDRPPRVPIALNDREVEQSLGGVPVYEDTTLVVAGASMRLRAGTIFRTQDRMTAHVIAANQWQLPVYFAITVPEENQAGFTRNCQLEGFAFRLLTDEQLAQNPIPPTFTEGTVDPDITVRNLKEKFRFRGVTDPKVYKDENASNLLINYAVVVATAARGLVELGREEEAGELLRWATEHIIMRPVHKNIAAIYARQAGDTTMALRLWEEVIDATDTIPDVTIQAYVNLIYTYAIMGRTQEAAGILRRWLEIAPSDSSARNWLRELEQGRIPESLRNLPSMR